MSTFDDDMRDELARQKAASSKRSPFAGATATVSSSDPRSTRQPPVIDYRHMPPNTQLPPKQQKQMAQGNSTFANLMDAVGVPMDVAGAAYLDAINHRQVLGDQPRGSNTAESHALELMGKGDFATMKDLYYPTSENVTRQSAAAGNPVAQYFQHHPRQRAVADFSANLLDPGNLAAGELGGLAGDVARGATRTVARTAARAATRVDPTLAAGPAVKYLMAAERAGTLNRFGGIRSAAEDLHRAAGGTHASVANAGEQAQMAASNLARAGGYAAGNAQRAANDVFKGLTKREQFEVVHLIEGDSSLLRVNRTPAQEAIFQKLKPRVDAYRLWRNGIDKRTAAYNVADPNRLLAGENYFSRAGMMEDPTEELGEEDLAVNDAFKSRFRSGGGTTVRKGTLGQNVHRKYPTLRAALRAGARVRPDATPMEAFEQHVYTRLQASRINEQLDRMQNLGLIVPKEVPVPGSAGVKIPSTRPPGYLNTMDLGSLHSFGSATTREGWIHPALADLIEDVGHSGRIGQQGGVASLMSAGSSVLGSFNRSLSALQVSNPAFHPLFNISENTIEQAPNLPTYAKKLFDEGAATRAEELGVHDPFARAQPAADWGRPWKDLTPLEKGKRLLAGVPHAVESFSAAPLYGHIEPRMATAAFEGLRRKFGEAGAFNRTRSILGNPENLAAAERNAAQFLQFPTWLKEMLRKWMPAVVTKPGLYNAPHAAIEDVNAEHGRGRKPGDAGRFLPPIVIGRTKEGDFIELDIPHPGDRASSIWADFVNKNYGGLMHVAAGGLNPGLSVPASEAASYLTSGKARDLAAVRPAEGAGQKLEDQMVGLFKRYVNPTNYFVRTELGPSSKNPQIDRQKLYDTIVSTYLYGNRRYGVPYGMTEIRAEQRKAEAMGDHALAEKISAYGDRQWNALQKVLQVQAMPEP